MLFQAKSAVEVLDNSVALTSGTFKALAIEDFYAAALVFDQSGALQNTRRQGHGGTSRAQHLRHKIVG